MRVFQRFLLVASLVALPYSLAQAQAITAAGQPAQLDVRVAGERSIRVTLKPFTFKEDFPDQPGHRSRALPGSRPEPARDHRAGAEEGRHADRRRRPNPLTLTRQERQRPRRAGLIFEADGNLSFKLDEHPVLGMGEGGPLPQRGAQLARAPGAVRSARTARHDAAALAGRHVRLAQPGRDAARHRRLGHVRRRTRGARSTCGTPTAACSCRGSPPTPTASPQNERNQQQALAKGLPPPDVGSFRAVRLLHLRRAAIPPAAMKDFSVITGPAAMPPLWALGYMQSHRTLEDDAQMLGIVETFRKKSIPLDAVIYLGTGFAPRAGTRGSRRSTSTRTSSSATRRR